jgi:hypothetical protein
MISRRHLVLGMGALATGVAGALPAAAEQPFVMEEFFAGRTIGKGSFTIPPVGLKRELVVKTRGKWNGRVLTLVEDFFFADGEKDRKTWRFTKIAPGQYEGTREDVVGKADIRQAGRLVTLAYEADVRAGDGTATRLGFKDVIGYRSSGGVYNTAIITRFGIPIGNVDLVFNKA